MTQSDFKGLRIPLRFLFLTLVPLVPAEAGSPGSPGSPGAPDRVPLGSWTFVHLHHHDQPSGAIASANVDSWATPGPQRGHDRHGPGIPCSSRRCCSPFPGGCRESPEENADSWRCQDGSFFKIPRFLMRSKIVSNDSTCYIFVDQLPWSKKKVLLGSLKGKSASTNPPPNHPAALRKAWNSLSAGVCTASRTKVQPVPTKREKHRACTLWWTNIAMENHHFQWENPLFLWPFSIAFC